jgi:hypothetical protein
MTRAGTIWTHSCQDVMTSRCASTQRRAWGHTHPTGDTHTHPRVEPTCKPQDRQQPRSTRPVDTMKAGQLGLTTRVHLTSSLAHNQCTSVSRNHSCVPSPRSSRRPSSVILDLLYGSTDPPRPVPCSSGHLPQVRRPAPSPVAFSRQPHCGPSAPGRPMPVSAPPRFHKNLLSVGDAFAEDPFSLW